MLADGHGLFLDFSMGYLGVVEGLSGSSLIKVQSQNITVAAGAAAERKVLVHLS